MAKEVKKPKEELAPSYFVQYSALWCILLGFFVMLLSLGNTQMGPGAEGVGQVRDAFGSTGGLGLLPFSKNALYGRRDGGASSLRIRKSAPTQIVEVDSYIRGMLWKKGLSSISMLNVIEPGQSAKVILQVPVAFGDKGQIEKKSVALLELLGELFLDLRQYDLEIMAVQDEKPDQQANQREALLQAAVVARLLTDASSLPPERVRAVGYSDTQLIRMHGMEPVKGSVLISIQKGKQ